MKTLTPTPKKSENPPHPFTTREKHLLEFFETQGFKAVDGFFCGGWDAENKKGQASTILLQEDSITLVQPSKLPHSVALPYNLRLPARELLHKEKTIAKKTSKSQDGMTM
jgi:hypothetical protein